MQEGKWTDEDMKDFALFIGNNLKKFKGKDVDEIFDAYLAEIDQESAKWFGEES